MAIGLILAMLMFALNVLIGFYNAGKYHNGGEDVRKGDSAAATSAVGAIIALVIFILLFIGV